MRGSTRDGNAVKCHFAGLSQYSAFEQNRDAVPPKDQECARCPVCIECTDLQNVSTSTQIASLCQSAAATSTSWLDHFVADRSFIRFRLSQHEARSCRTNAELVTLSDAAANLSSPNVRKAPGFWRPDPLSSDIYECLVPEACTGSDDAQQQCTTGYSGPRCAVCEQGFAKVAGKCLQCIDDGGIATLYALGTLAFFFFLWWVARNRRTRPRVRFTVLAFYPDIELSGKNKSCVIGVVTTIDGGLRLHQIEADTSIQRHLAIKLGHHIGRTFEIEGLLEVDQRDPLASPAEKLLSSSDARKKCVVCESTLKKYGTFKRYPEVAKKNRASSTSVSRVMQLDYVQRFIHIRDGSCWYDRLFHVVYKEIGLIPEPVRELLIAFHGLPLKEPDETDWQKWKQGEDLRDKGFLHFHRHDDQDHVPNRSSTSCSCSWRIPTEFSA